MATRPKFEREIRVYGSELIKKVRYDAHTWVLDVQLKSGQSYRYRGIGPSSFSQLVTSGSPGKVYNERIKTHFGDSRRVTKIRSWP